MNTGKVFEQDFKQSIPEEIFFYRFKDSSNQWGSNNKVRFTPSNICDCLLYDGDNLYLLELKSCKGKSLPLNNIREHQIDDLYTSSNYKNIIAGFVINFSEVGRCFFIDTLRLKDFIAKEDRKSIPINYLEEFGLEINCQKKITHYRYDVEGFIKGVVRY